MYNSLDYDFSSSQKSKPNVRMNRIEANTENIIMALYNTVVHHHLEYWLQYWSTHFQKDIAELVGVSRRATRMIKGTEKLSHE